jgi:ribosomal protein S18 acetylase RimI-like enzyme
MKEDQLRNILSHNTEEVDDKRLKIIEARKATKKYKQALIELINTYLSDDMGEKRALGRKTQRRLALQLFKHPGAMVFFAKAKNKLIGLAVCFVGFSTFYAQRIINIHDLIVLPEYRGQGVAGKLLEAIEKKGRKIGCCKLTLEVRIDNVKAMRLYEKFGFGVGDYPMRFWMKGLL